MGYQSKLLKALVACSILLFQGCIKDHNPDPSIQVVGYLYTTTNGEDINQVVKFSRHADGSLSDETAYPTNSKGGADVKAGGDAHGDFDAQGAVQIIGDYLLNTNAGGNQISVYSLNKSNGDIAFKSNTISGGTRPVSIAYTKKSGIDDEYWVVVGNQWNNPNVQKDGAAIERYPDNAFHAQDLTQPDATDNERNIQLFTFNAKTGALSPEKQLDKYVRENGGPTTVSFSPDGKKLAVATWGIAHFATKLTSLDEQHPSRVYVYDFTNGSVSNRRYFEEAGISGTIGFNWAILGNSRLFVSNFNLIPAKLDNSVTVLDDNGSTVAKASNYGVSSPSAIDEACWTVLNSTGDKLFVASFQTNLVSTFNVGSSGLMLTKTEARSGIAPNGDSKELWISPDNKYVYNLGAFQSFSINLFENSGSGAAYKSQTFLKTTSAGAGIAGKYNFLGLAGFDL
ncbi:hypothetical protein [Dyadobacter arcticus]|uniref:Lactonase, 7-bladed beta-propeller n=1 Tax=Dyadobacter arcticus TaxID=1078754 RepID=A0ABX0UN74_9BACT|nr:hypothetical protein [Dyadobacter arcticus]NIJ52536.1 hypothetical protein [Dyadobacter arcticus]